MKIQISQLILLISVMILHMTDADQKLIDTTCKNTPDYKLCTAIIRANPRGAGADLPVLGLIVVDVVNQKTVEALSILGKLMKSGQPKVLPAVKQCIQVYKAVLEGDIPVAKQAIRGNPKFAETAMADARVEAYICQNALEEAGAKLVLRNLNNYVTQVAAVARAIIRNLL